MYGEERGTILALGYRYHTDETAYTSFLCYWFLSCALMLSYLNANHDGKCYSVVCGNMSKYKEQRMNTVKGQIQPKIEIQSFTYPHAAVQLGEVFPFKKKHC